MRNKNKRSFTRITNGVIILCLVSLLASLFCKKKDDLQQGIDALQKGDYEKAVKLLSKELVTDTLNPDLHYNLSLAYAHLDSANKALNHYVKAVELNSSHKDDIILKELLAEFLGIEPYATSLISMKKMHQFKGTISPNGQLIAVAAAKRDRADIYLLTLDGKINKKITERAMNTDPDFAPDGMKIAYVSDVDGDEEIYLYDLKSSETTQLTSNKAKDFSPSFSPDGIDIVFISNMDDQYKWEVYKINIQNKKIKRLTKNNYWDGFPKFSSDNNSIIFSSKRNGHENIFRMNKNGGGEKILFQCDADANDPQLVNDNLYFKCNIEGQWEIYRYHLSTKKLTRLTRNSYEDWNPRVSADGSKICITRRIKDRWRLYFINFTSPVSAELIVEKVIKANE